MLVGCARPLLGPDSDDASDESDSSGEPQTQSSSSDDGESSTTDEPEPAPACHASYEPCLPVVDDLDCSDVRDLGLGPVVVIGADAYGLDADGDGIGCE